MAKRKPWYYRRLDYNCIGLDNCCSVMEVGNIYINGYDEDDYREPKHKLTQIAVSSEIKRMTKDLSQNKYVKGFVLTITERMEHYKFFVKALKANGWKLAMKCVTSHTGQNYNVLMYTRSFKR